MFFCHKSISKEHSQVHRMFYTALSIAKRYRIHYSHLSRDFSSAAMMDHNLTVDTHSSQLFLLHVVTAESEPSDQHIVTFLLFHHNFIAAWYLGNSFFKN